MPGWKFAFGLSTEAVKTATPPGTVLLIGKNHSSVWSPLSVLFSFFFFSNSFIIQTSSSLK
jgi:hypothetical protein